LWWQWNIYDDSEIFVILWWQTEIYEWFLISIEIEDPGCNGNRLLRE
jgi:hypothetical protein